MSDENRVYENSSQQNCDKMQPIIKTNRIPKIFTNLATQVLYVLVIPVFFYAFSVIYRPLHIQQFYDLGQGRFTFNIIILSCILLGCMLFMRTIFFLIRKKELFTSSWYIAWTVLEFIVMAHFVTLYTWLIYHHTMPYFEVLANAIKFVTCILVYPYLVIGISLRLSDKNHQSNGVAESTRMRFYDSRKTLKLVVLAQNVLYIEAEENYVHIYYIENEKAKDYLLRTSMKQIEELCQMNGLTRCHRSYFVNASHVRLLMKDKDGFIYAELDNLEKRIPVTKRYYESLSNLL